jgi:hypothetical protein
VLQATGGAGINREGEVSERVPCPRRGGALHVGIKLTHNP